MFGELKTLAIDSRDVFPNRNTPHQPVSKTILNSAVRTLDLQIRDFVINDFRRTTSTIFHEQDYNSYWLEKVLAHKISGTRGIYNRAQY